MDDLGIDDFGDMNEREMIETIEKEWAQTTEREKAMSVMLVHQINPSVMEYEPKEYECNICGNSKVVSPRVFVEEFIAAFDKEGGFWKFKHLLDSSVDTKAICPECNHIDEAMMEPDSPLGLGNPKEGDDKFDIHLM